jgi:hypothetical protein
MLCKEDSFSGEMKTTGAQTVTVTPTFGNCTFAGQKATVEMRGCAFVLHQTGTVDIAGTKCATEPMRFSVSSPGCTVTVGPQSGLSKASISNLTNYSSIRYLAVGLELAALQYTATGAGCPETGTFSTGSFKAILQKVGATNASKAAENLWVDP